VSEENFPLTLGERAWALPHLRFGAIKRLQPRLLRLNQALAAGGAETLADRLDELALDELLSVVLDALREVDPGLTREALEDMPFTAAELVLAQTAVMRACGLILVDRRAAAAAEGPKA